MSILRARELVEQDRHCEALGALLAAWYEVRSPRTADVIDLVSARAASTEPIGGKNVKERLDAWLAIADRKDPVDLPRLMSELWPKKWQDAHRLLRALFRWPDDPRLGALLIRTAADPPFTSAPADVFFAEVFHQIRVIADLRGIPALRAIRDQQRAHADGANRSLEVLERKLARLPALSPDEDEALAAIVARLADDAAPATASASPRGEQLLAAIHDAPDDDAARAVYADWLTEQGDSHGELIALQLARAADPARAVSERERELLATHGATWAGMLGALFAGKTHLFERGFFAGGELSTTSLDAAVDARAARLVEHVAWYETPAELPDLFAIFPRLRSLSVRGPMAAKLAAGREAPSLERLAFTLEATPDDALEVLATCPAFPALRELAIDFPGTTLARNDFPAAAPLLDRITTLELRGDWVRLLGKLLARRSALRRLVIVPRSWRAVFSRDSGDGPFTACTLTCLDPRRRDVLRELTTLINYIPEGATRVELDPDQLALDARAREAIDVELARFDAAAVVKPWQVTDADAPILEIDITGRPMLDPDLVGPLWSLLQEIDQRYDVFVVGRGATQKPLGDDPSDRLATWARNRRVDALTLRNSSGADRLAIGALRTKQSSGWSPKQQTSLVIVLRGRTHDLPSWFARLLRLTEAKWGWCRTPDGWASIAPDDKHLPLGWLTLIPLELARRLRLEELARDPDPALAGLSILREPDDPHVILVAAPTPEATRGRIGVIAQRLRELGGL